VFSGVCTAVAVAYFAMAEYQQGIPNVSPQESKGPPDEATLEFASVPTGNSGSVSTEVAQSGAEEQAQVTVVADHHRELSTAEDASLSVQSQIDNGPVSDVGLRAAIHPSSNPLTDSPVELAVTSPHENLAMAYSSDPYGLLPPWLVKSGFDTPRKSDPAPAEKSVVQNEESPILALDPNAQQAPTIASNPKRAISERAQPVRKRDPERLLFSSEVSVTALAPTREQIIPDFTGTRASAAAAAPPAPEKRTPALTSTEAAAESSKPAEAAVVSAPQLAEQLSQQPRTVDPVSPTTPKLALANENNAIAPLAPENNAPALARTQAPEGNSKFAEIAVVSALGLAEPLPKHPKAADSVSPSTPKPLAVASGNSAATSLALENTAPVLPGKVPAENGKPAEMIIVSAPESGKDLPQQPQSADSLSLSKPKPLAPAGENNAAASPVPENDASPLTDTKALAENNRSENIAVVSAPKIAEPLPQQPKTADPVSRSRRKQPAGDTTLEAGLWTGDSGDRNLERGLWREDSVDRARPPAPTHAFHPKIARVKHRSPMSRRQNFRVANFDATARPAASSPQHVGSYPAASTPNLMTPKMMNAGTELYNSDYTQPFKNAKKTP
jgi:hypothetical protein